MREIQSYLEYTRESEISIFAMSVNELMRIALKGNTRLRRQVACLEGLIYHSVFKEQISYIFKEVGFKNIQQLSSIKVYL